jgi:hypothetical protein
VTSTGIEAVWVTRLLQQLFRFRQITGPGLQRQGTRQFAGRDAARQFPKPQCLGLDDHLPVNSVIGGQPNAPVMLGGFGVPLPWELRPIGGGSGDHA